MATCVSQTCVVASDFQVYSIDGLPSNLLPVPEGPSFVPATPVCLSLDCTVSPDLEVYSVDTIVPQPLPPVVEPTYLNSVVYYSITACGAGLHLVVDDSGFPSWITFDAANQRLIGAAGYFSGSNQTEANTTAQNALNLFGAGAISSGAISCEAILGYLFYDDFEDYVDGAYVNGLDLGDWTNFPSPYVDR